ncbi:MULTISPECIES: hypothetical protein [Arthrobacter]|uniref:Uncharacterized protein n=2 Tax=Arthrobacter TaxID=1663 RepID=A0ABU9KFW6_9MICC|nr:hypothetical protein [Arthrobacter sp. YJM1]MDP5225770.1 hypothetical protein [Arthrobacter sp. YJM1]
MKETNRISGTSSVCSDWNGQKKAAGSLRSSMAMTDGAFTKADRADAVIIAAEAMNQQAPEA